jgi:hypothetical protein
VFPREENDEDCFGPLSLTLSRQGRGD